MLARGSVIWILLPFILALIFIFVFIIPLAVLFLLITLFFIIFFRDPQRRTGWGIVAPADGVVSNIEVVSNTSKISIVMGLFDVHVNRAPFDGKVFGIEHHKGKHKPAANKDSEMNEKVVTTIKTSFGKVKLVQIAGAFARRIVPYMKKGDRIVKGQKIGMIRFGSRVDLYLPSKRTRVLARVGVRVIAGESCVAVVVENEA
ncbi:MAG: phosphatidylserine decarboxylase [Methanomassiliicoccales archaeon]|nr:MAG: phosphatidylserine decarboxylase [Methanomassiliicoccales archaeon]